MTDMNKYILAAVAAIVVLGALWFYMSGEETISPTPTSPPAEQTPGGTTK